MSPGNEIRIWHSLTLKCKRGVLALPEQFIIKASEFLLNIHEVQWIITGLAIITNFSKCADKRVKYIIFPYVIWMDDLNGFLKLGNFILSLNVFYTLSHFAQCGSFYLLFLFSGGEKMAEWEQSGRREMSPATIRELLLGSHSSLPAARLYFPFLPRPQPKPGLRVPDSSALSRSVSFYAESNSDHNKDECALRRSNNSSRSWLITRLNLLILPGSNNHCVTDVWAAVFRNWATMVNNANNKYQVCCTESPDWWVLSSEGLRQFNAHVKRVINENEAGVTSNTSCSWKLQPPKKPPGTQSKNYLNYVRVPVFYCAVIWLLWFRRWINMNRSHDL